MVVRFWFSYILNMNDCSLLVFIYTDQEWLFAFGFHIYWTWMIVHFWFSYIMIKNDCSYFDINNQNDCSFWVFIYKESEWLFLLFFHIYWTWMIVRFWFSYIQNMNGCSFWVFIYTDQEWLFLLCFHIYWSRMIVRFWFSYILKMNGC